MIKLLTASEIPAFTDFCEKNVLACVIYTRFLAYGLNDSEIMFWYAKNGQEITAVCSVMDGIFSFCGNENADICEIIEFSKIIGSRHIYTEKNCFLMKYCATNKTHTADDLNGENVRNIFSVIFENEKIFSDKMYTDISHKIRHGLIHGKCIFSDNRCVSVALTSGETSQNAIISSVATLSDYRRQGFGENVVNSLAESLPQKNIFLLTDNKETADWYKKIGWKIIKQYT